MKKNPKELVFVKLGGAAITYKDTPNKANLKILQMLSRELAECTDYKLLIGHGGGSFPHPVAEKYKVQDGLKTCKAEGFVKTQKAARDLNKIVMDSLLEAGMDVIPIQPSACITLNDGKIKDFYLEPIHGLLKSNITPVIYGDVVVDIAKGCSIVSTETLLEYIARKLFPKRVIIGTDVDGVFTLDPKKEKGATLIKEVNQENIGSILSMLTGSVHKDVTGGMAHKMEELYKLSKLNMEVCIINLLKPGHLKRAIQGEQGLGTDIKLKQVKDEQD